MKIREKKSGTCYKIRKMCEFLSKRWKKKKEAVFNYFSNCGFVVFLDISPSLNKRGQCAQGVLESPCSEANPQQMHHAWHMLQKTQRKKQKLIRAEESTEMLVLARTSKMSQDNVRHCIRRLEIQQSTDAQCDTSSYI